MVTSPGITSAVTVAVALVLAQPLRAQECPGDCNSDGVVAVNELVTAVGVALAPAAGNACQAVDLNLNDVVSIDELIRAVDAALNACPGDATRAILRPFRLVALGSSVEDVKAIQGSPDQENAGFLSYQEEVDGGFSIIEYSFAAGRLIDINVDTFLDSADASTLAFRRLVAAFTATHGTPFVQEASDRLFAARGEEVDVALLTRTTLQGNGGVAVGLSRGTPPRLPPPAPLQN